MLDGRPVSIPSLGFKGMVDNLYMSYAVLAVNEAIIRHRRAAFDI